MFNSFCFVGCAIVLDFLFSTLFQNVHVFFLIAAQAHAICDKVQAGGVHMAGAVGGATVSGGVVVAVPPHIPLDDFSDDEDDNQAEIGLSVQDKNSETFQYCYCSFKHLCIHSFVSLRTLVMMMRPAI